jgi:hypothetical protein
MQAAKKKLRGRNANTGVGRGVDEQFFPNLAK